MTGMLLDKKSMFVLFFFFTLTVWQNGTHRVTANDLYVIRDIVTTCCILVLCTFAPVFFKIDKKAWNWPWSNVVSCHGGPPSNTWRHNDRLSYFTLPPAHRSAMREARQGPACKAWPLSYMPQMRGFSYDGLVEEWNECSFHKKYYEAH